MHGPCRRANPIPASTMLENTMHGFQISYSGIRRTANLVLANSILSNTTSMHELEYHARGWLNGSYLAEKKHAWNWTTMFGPSN